MEDRDFFDLLYQTWSKTSGDEDTFWMPEEGTIHDPGWHIWAVGQKQGREHLGSFSSGEDADFITAVHGCLPDLIRRLTDAVDEADRLDKRVDEQTERIAELELQVDDLLGTLDSERKDQDAQEQYISTLLDELETARTDAGFYQQQWMEGR